MPRRFGFGALPLVRRVIANPLQLTGLGLPPQLVLLARLLALALLFGSPVAPEPFPLALRAAVAVGAAGMLFSQFPRVFAALAGGALLLVSSRLALVFEGGYALAGLLLVLVAISRASGPPNQLFKGTMAAIYLGTALSQAFEPGWQSAWPLMSIEIALAVAAAVPRLHSWFVWGSGLLQCGLTLAHGGAFDLSFYGMQSVLVALTRWPEPVITVIWDGSCGFCRRSKEQFERVDFDRVMEWVPLQSNIGERYGLTRAELRQALHAAGPGWLLSGYSALRRMVLYLPLFAYVLFAMAALAPGPIARNAVVGAVLLFLSPVSNPVGNAVYGWIARHRHELLASETCELPDQS